VLIVGKLPKSFGASPRLLRECFCHDTTPMNLTPVDDRIDLSAISAAVRSSSNFRFSWQFYDFKARDLLSPDTIRFALEAIIRREDLHAFLRHSLDDIYPREFEIEPLHSHASINRDNAYFLDTLTRASLDRLGAYSCDLTPSTAIEREPIHELFSSIGTYAAFTTTQGSFAGCEICKRHNNDLFCNWFFDVAWDYTFLLTWPTASVLWVGCLTDTD
jgi:hypothetical protein